MSTPAADVAVRAQALLEVLAGPGAVLRPEQLAAIEAVVVDGRRALVVQRTGFGKSAIYFIATRLLPRRRRRAHARRVAAARPHARPGRRRRAHGRAVRHHQLHQPRRLGRRSRRPSPPARSTCSASAPSASTTPASSARVLPRLAGRPRAARRRRGPLHQRLGPRLPARLPPHPRRHRQPRARARRCSPPPPPPTSGSCADVAEQLGDDVARAAGHPRPRVAPPRRGPPPDGWPTAWPGWPSASPTWTAPASSTASPSRRPPRWPTFLRSAGHRRRRLLVGHAARGASARSRRRSRPTRSRRSSPPAPSAWASTSPTSLRRPPRRAAVAHRLLPAGGPGRARRAPGRGVAAARRRGPARSGPGSPRSACRRSPWSAGCSTPSARRGRPGEPGRARARGRPAPGPARDAAQDPRRRRRRRARRRRVGRAPAGRGATTRAGRPHPGGPRRRGRRHASPTPRPARCLMRSSSASRLDDPARRAVRPVHGVHRAPATPSRSTPPCVAPAVELPARRRRRARAPASSGPAASTSRRATSSPTCRPTRAGPCAGRATPAGGRRSRRRSPAAADAVDDELVTGIAAALKRWPLGRPARRGSRGCRPPTPAATPLLADVAGADRRPRYAAGAPCPRPPTRRPAPGDGAQRRPPLPQRVGRVRRRVPDGGPARSGAGPRRRRRLGLDDDRRRRRAPVRRRRRRPPLRPRSEVAEDRTPPEPVSPDFELWACSPIASSSDRRPMTGGCRSSCAGTEHLVAGRGVGTCRGPGRLAVLAGELAGLYTDPSG